MEDLITRGGARAVGKASHAAGGMGRSARQHTPASQPQGPTTFKKEGGGGGGGPQATYQKTSGKSAFGAEHVEKPSIRENLGEKLKKGVTKDGGGGASSTNTLQGASYEPSIKNLTPNVNAQSALAKKLSAVQNAKTRAAKIKRLPDGRVRYYEAERPSNTPGPTRGASYVVEHNPKTGQVRSWNECYDHSGMVNRVRPKTIDGQDLSSQHYPLTKSELMRK